MDPAGRSGDLDALIGDIRREAARRRASPDFPLDEEATLGGELDRQGPLGASPDLDAIVGRLRQLSSRAGKPAVPGPPSGSEGPVEVAADVTAEVARLVASAVRALGLRLHQVEARGTTGARPGSSSRHPGAPGSPLAPGPQPGDEPDLDAVLAGLAPPGRLLITGSGCGPWLDLLGGDGRHPYGLDPSGGPYVEGAEQRGGSLLDHLRTVGDRGLAAVVVAGAPPAAEVPVLEHVAAEMARASRRVLVISLMPWWWRRQGGDGRKGDLAIARPLEPGTWLEVLDGAGLEVEARFGENGRAYLVTADLASR